MIIFKYGSPSVSMCHTMIRAMQLPGEQHESEALNDEGTKIVWKGDEFVALFYPNESRMELYPTKNTNSINYFINRYEHLDWDTWQKVKTKRW